jgi:hypothetical protein
MGRRRAAVTSKSVHHTLATRRTTHRCLGRIPGVGKRQQHRLHAGGVGRREHEQSREAAAHALLDVLATVTERSQPVPQQNVQSADTHNAARNARVPCTPHTARESRRGCAPDCREAPGSVQKHDGLAGRQQRTRDSVQARQRLANAARTHDFRHVAGSESTAEEPIHAATGHTHTVTRCATRGCGQTHTYVRFVAGGEGSSLPQQLHTAVRFWAVRLARKLHRRSHFLRVGDQRQQPD